MKKLSLFLFLLLGITAKGLCFQEVLNVTNVSHPTNVDQFDLFEVSFSTVVTGNPYDPDSIDVYAVFIGPNNCRDTVIGFYYEDFTFEFDTDNGCEKAYAHPSNNGWRVRYTPKYAGTWGFYIVAIHTIPGSIIDPPVNKDAIIYHRFTCLPVEEANGFISLANNRYLKREVVRNYQTEEHSFFPVGPNIAWYGCNDYGYFMQPLGIYDYERYIDSLDGRANYMRVFINRYQALSLYGPEYTQPDQSGNPTVYFNNTINQIDSAELDYIIDYAKQHGVTVMLCVFSCGDFRIKNNHDHSDPSIWTNNPFYNILGLESPCDFFADNEAKAISKNLIRYIVSRWGYATNIMAWEFWNEVDQLLEACEGNKRIEQDVMEWHEDMLDYVQSIDPHHHCVSSSMAGPNHYSYMYSGLFDELDFVQIHNYGNIQNAETRFQIPILLLNRVNNDHTHYPTKPCFIAEFGFSQGNSTHAAKDPYGINLHNCNWASLFSSSMGSGSFWWWPYVDDCGLFQHFAPLSYFCQDLPIPSASFTAHHTGEYSGNQLVFQNGLQTFYMTNTNQDTIYGWSQDTAFTYPSLRCLTDSVEWVDTDWGLRLVFKNNAVFDPAGYVYTLSPSKKPVPSSNSNEITLPITNQPEGSRYLVTWYDSETGAPLNLGAVFYALVQQDSLGNKTISFQFPSLIRDLQHQIINNKYGDAVFVLVPAPSPIDKTTFMD